MRKMKKKNKALGGIAAKAVICIGVMIPITASTAPWEYGAIVDVGVIHSDNIFLSDAATNESETVYSIIPEFFLMTDADRINANLRYRPEAYFYSDNSDADDIFHVLDAVLTGALIRDRFFVDLSATAYQSIVDPEGRIPTSNIPISGNRVDSQTFEIRPYWRQRVGQANVLVEGSYLKLKYDDEDAYQGSDERSGRLRIDNIERQQGLAWGIDYHYRRVEYDVSTPWEFQRAALDLGYWINGSTRIFAVGGAETDIDDIFEANLDADFWEAGFQYKPSQRMNLELAAGNRSYGTSFRGDFSYTLRRGEVSLTYSEVPSNRSEDAFTGRPILDTDDLDNLLDQAGASDRYLRRRGEFRIAIDLAKSNLTLRVFSERHDERTTADGAPLAEEDLSGVALRWNWNFGTRTSLGISGDFSDRDQSGIKDEIGRAQIDLIYDITQKMNIRLEALHSTQDGKDTNQSDYDENQVRLLLRTEF